MNLHPSRVNLVPLHWFIHLRCFVPVSIHIVIMLYFFNQKYHMQPKTVVTKKKSSLMQFYLLEIEAWVLRWIYGQPAHCASLKEWSGRSTLRVKQLHYKTNGHTIRHKPAVLSLLSFLALRFYARRLWLRREISSHSSIGLQVSMHTYNCAVVHFGRLFY